jgi:tRNA nucleotidyltransferase (CCA-adding enzyme)
VNDHDWVVVGATPEQMLALGYLPVGGLSGLSAPRDARGIRAGAHRAQERARLPGLCGADSPDVTLEEDLARRDLTINSIAAALIQRALPAWLTPTAASATCRPACCAM